MAILDKKLELMDAASIAGAPAATVSSEVLDLGTGYNEWGVANTPNIGEGGDLYLNIRVATLIEAAGGSTPFATCKLWTHTTATVASGTLLLTQVIGTAAAAGVDVLRAKIPAGTISRYLGLVTTVGAVTITAGALDAWIGMDTESPLPTR
jgi:hypothetical protein